MHRITLKTSQSGRQLIKEARSKKIEQEKQRKIRTQGTIERGWDMNEIFVIEASKILQPDKIWDNVSAEHCPVSLASWKRFREAKQPIDAFTFKAFCQVLELNWEDVVENEEDANRDLSEAPPLVNFYGRTQELEELQQWLIKERCRLILIHGMGGIGKSALVRHLVDRIAGKYNCLIWLSLESSPLFQETLNRLLQFLSKGEQQKGDISQIMLYLRDQKCLIVLDNWEEIIKNDQEDYTNYSLFVERVTNEAHKSCLLLLSRKKTQNIERLEGQLVLSKKLGALTYEEAKEILIGEGISGTDSKQEIEKFSTLYSNPWILKRIVQSIHNVFGGDLSQFMESGISLLVDDVITDFLDRNFKGLSREEINLIYWVALRRNTASWDQLVKDSKNFLTYDKLFQTLNYLLVRHSLLAKNTEDVPVIYILDPVVLKYTTERFITENYKEIIQVFRDKNLNGSELFVTHAFITEYPKDEELNQEQMRRIIRPIQQMLLANFRSQEQLEEQLKKLLSLLEKQSLSQSNAYQNISHLISACKKQI